MIDKLRAMVRMVITLGLVVSYIAMVFSSLEVPAEFYGLVALALAFYFKDRNDA